MLQILSSSFLSQPWAMALFIVIDVAVLILIIALNYKICAKRLLDILFSLVAMAVFLPFFIIFLIIQAIYAKKTGEYESLFCKTYFLGKKQKLRYKTRFTCENKLGEITKLGKVLKAIKIAYYPQLVNVFTGNLSFIGPMPLSVADCNAIKEEDSARFSVRAGLISSLERYGGEGLTYPDMFEEDAEYVKSRNFFKDISFFCAYFLAKIRGDKRNKLGECSQKTYIQSLLESEKITEEQAQKLEEQANEQINNGLSNTL